MRLIRFLSLHLPFIIDEFDLGTRLFVIKKCLRIGCKHRCKLLFHLVSLDFILEVVDIENKERRGLALKLEMVESLQWTSVDPLLRCMKCSSDFLSGSIV